MTSFQAVVHARQEAKRDLSTLRETVRMRAAQRLEDQRRAAREETKDDEPAVQVDRPA